MMAAVWHIGCKRPINTHHPLKLCTLCPPPLPPQAEELAQVEALRAEEQRKLQRDRRVLEKQSRALLKLPTKREKEEIQALEARWGTGGDNAGCMCATVVHDQCSAVCFCLPQLC